jgi:hypothetical protein
LGAGNEAVPNHWSMFNSCAAGETNTELIESEKLHLVGPKIARPKNSIPNLPSRDGKNQKASN